MNGSDPITATTAASNKDTSNSGSTAMLQQSLTEVIQKVDSSLPTGIGPHPQYDAPKQGLDFLDTKNSLFLSYLIELTYHLRNHLLFLQQQQQQQVSKSDSNAPQQSLHRFRVMKTGLDKLRGLDKKLRYQIDKLLAHASAAASANHGSAQFATALAATAPEDDEEDPLQFRPGMAQENDNDDNSSTSSSSGSEREDGNATKDHSTKVTKVDHPSEPETNEASDLDDDLAAAKRTISMARVKRQTFKGKSNDDDDDPDDSNNNNDIYRAPRLAAVPYAHDEDQRGLLRERRVRRQLRASEVAQTLRLQYGEAPEQDDVEGGAGVGRQRAAARRLQERERERTAFEEDNMIRLATPRAEKKERKRLMREETSNLAAIADIGSLARDSSLRRQHRTTTLGGFDRNFEGDEDDRYANGKRRRQVTDRDGRATGKGERRPKAQNPLQQAMFGTSSSGKNKKRKSKR